MLLGDSFFAHAPLAARRVAAVARALEVRDRSLGLAGPLSLPGDVTRADREAVLRAERALAQAPFHDAGATFEWLVAEPANAIAALAALSDRPRSLAGERLAELFPPLAGLASPGPAATYEHDAQRLEGPPLPVLEHAMRALAHAMAGELPREPGRRSALVCALLFADVAKCGSPELRAEWRERLGVDGAAHNLDSAAILGDLLARLPASRARVRTSAPRWIARAVLLCSLTGAVGMRLRGEVDVSVYGALRVAARDEREREALLELLPLLDRCDTAAVREGLFTAELARAFALEEARALAHAPPSSATLTERVARMRHGALVGDQHLEEAEEALRSLGDARATLDERLERASTWYAEAALGGLTPSGMVRALLLLTGTASKTLDTSVAWHLDMRGLVSALRDERGAPRTYPTRLLEALLAESSLEGLARGELGATRERALVSLRGQKGHDDALFVSFSPSAEAGALFTLLEVYEQKDSTTFHATLKALCDLYGLRKDDFDRVSNEASYLETMNAARTDKARMVELAAPGCIVEVGPGGGVVLDLCEARFPGTRIVGLDASRKAIEALEAHRATHGRSYELVHGDAFELATLFPERSVTTVIFCSVLHEIFSYVPWSEREGEPPARFRLGAVLALVRAAFRALAPGGRIVVRDGVMPAPEPVVLRFNTPSWAEGLVHFAKVYEARAIPFEVLEGPSERPTKVRLAAPDAYEFLTTYTWGPASFPYEIREQRAVLPRDEAEARLVEACREADPPFTARALTVPRHLASYLQPGYPANISPHVRLFDAADENELPLFDINGVWGVEKLEPRG